MTNDYYSTLFMETWREAQPKTYRQWKREGVLDQKASEASEKIKDKVATLVSQGLDLCEAREIAYPMYLYPPQSN